MLAQIRQHVLDHLIFIVEVVVQGVVCVEAVDVITVEHEFIGQRDSLPRFEVLRLVHHLMPDAHAPKIYLLDGSLLLCPIGNRLVRRVILYDRFLWVPCSVVETSLNIE